MISFIILNYKSFEDSLLCIKSIQNIKTRKKISIIVVDNGTLTKEEIIKLKKYTKDIVLLNENLGFAKGNNRGCQYAIKKYHPNFLCVINSDTEINQINFIDKIYKIDQEYHFDVLGPKILPTELDSCNPFPAYTDLKTVEEKIQYTKRLIKIYKSPLLRKILKLYSKIKNKKYPRIKLQNGEKVMLNVPLHGCALIFSKKYYQQHSDVFYNGTFLFHEEEFLYQRCLREKLTFVYHPEIEIIHKEGKSLDKKYKNKEYDKLIFKNEEILKSLLLLKEVIEKGREI